MVYIDLLVIEELVTNYIIILGTSLLLNRHTNFRKIFLSSVIGTIPLIFLFTNTHKLLLMFISFIIIIVMSIISFKYKYLIYTIKNVFYMYFLSVFLAGSIYLINTNFLPKIDNYLLNAIVLLIVFPIITYIYIKSYQNIKNNTSNYYQIDIYLKDKPKITVLSYLDTGNILKDPYKGRPIILVNKDLINQEEQKTILVPYNTIDSHGLLKCFSPEKIYIKDIGYRNKLLIGLIDKVGIEGAECILNKEVLERI